MFRLPGPVKLPATVAIFDCGTNSVLLLVTRLQSNGKVTALYQAIASPRLGEGLTGKGKLNPKATTRTLLTLRKLKKQAGHFKPDIFLALGTNIFRRAQDGKTVAHRLEKELDFPFLILSASEECPPRILRRDLQLESEIQSRGCGRGRWLQRSYLGRGQ